LNLRPLVGLRASLVRLDNLLSSPHNLSTLFRYGSPNVGVVRTDTAANRWGKTGQFPDRPSPTLALGSLRICGRRRHAGSPPADVSTLNRGWPGAKILTRQIRSTGSISDLGDYQLRPNSFKRLGVNNSLIAAKNAHHALCAAWTGSAGWCTLLGSWSDLPGPQHIVAVALK